MNVEMGDDPASFVPPQAPGPAPEPDAAARGAPRVWLVLGDKLGDNRQVEVVAEALPWRYEVRRLVFRARWRQGKPPFWPSLFHVDRAASDGLEPPWPDLVLTIGRRPAMAALWIRARTGGRARVVLFGRPKRFFDRFALVVVPVQYRLPEASNVLRLGLPLMRVATPALHAAGENWREALAALPRPLTVVLVGGRTKPFELDAGVAEDLMARVRAATGAAGSIYVTTSRRTPASVVTALERGLPPSGRLHAWRAGSGGADNPYFGLLAHGDRFVVTGDSVSMMTEVARLGRPLWVYPLPVRGRYRVVRDVHARARQSGLARRAAQAREHLRRWGLAGWPRDLTAMHRLLYARGLAAPLGDPLPGPASAPHDEVQRVCHAIETLVARDDARRA